ncbi:MAG: metallophosphoesterase family protein [Hyphomicrobium sp.]
MTRSITLAHLSDIHLSPVVGFHARHINAKRALGFLNWQRGRKYVHDRSVADRLVDDAKALRVDHIVLTGDLINLGLPAEYDAARDWLAGVGPPENVTVIPGNHDVYTRLSGHPGIGAWSAYMGAEAGTLAFPFVRRLGSVALIGLNSAIETPPFVAAGQLGQHQIEIAGDLLRRLGEEGLTRVVLIHHPPLPGQANARRGLSDASALQHMLQRSGAEIVLYGHNHREKLDWLDREPKARGAPIAVIGVPSASASRSHKGEPLARYNVLTIFGERSGRRLRHSVRGLQSSDGPIVKLSETVFNLGS